MAEPDLLRFLLLANRLKMTPRTGWLIRGLTDVESVAAHSYGVALVALTLAGQLHQPIDGEKLLVMALIHDLPEALITDIPGPAQRFFPEGARSTAEAAALTELLGSLSVGPRLTEIWQELKAGQSPEARLARDADRLDMLVQAHVYEQSTSNRYLEEFWIGQNARPFEFEVSQRLYEALVDRRRKYA